MAAKKLWGAERPRDFMTDMVILALYKDTNCIGYQALASSNDFKYVLTHDSLQHNIPLVRAALQGWSNQRITEGTMADWNAAARIVKFAEPVGKVHLWMDSTDFRLKGKRKTSRKDESWSYKLNSPGQRYMAVVDAKGRVRRLWGGYSPKVYDGSFLTLNEHYFREHYRGATVIADNHFAQGKNFSKDVKFLINYTTR